MIEQLAYIHSALTVTLNNQDNFVAIVKVSCN